MIFFMIWRIVCFSVIPSLYVDNPFFSLTSVFFKKCGIEDLEGF